MADSEDFFELFRNLGQSDWTVAKARRSAIDGGGATALIYDFIEQFKPIGWASPHHGSSDAQSRRRDSSIKKCTKESDKARAERKRHMLEKAFNMISSTHTRGDQNYKSPHYISPESELAPILTLMENNINEYRKVEAEDTGECFQPFAFYDYQRDGIGMAGYLDRTKGAVVQADDMGLGKTMQTIAVLLANPMSGPTLVVVPASLIPQWKKDITQAMKTAEAEGQLIVYEGQKHITERDLQNAKVVISSYNRVQIQYATMMASFRATEARHKDSTTIRFPDPMFKEPTELEIKLSMQEGTPIPTPNLLPTPIPHTSCPFFRVHWARIVLDEAHGIKNVDTSIFAAVCALIAERRIILTGTPLVNDYIDLRAYFAFLKLSPFDDAFFFLTHFINVKKNTKTERLEQPLLLGTRGALLNLALKSVTIRRLKWGTFEELPITSVPPPTFNVLKLTLDDGDKYQILPNVLAPDSRKKVERFGWQKKSVRTFFDWVNEGRSLQEKAGDKGKGAENKGSMDGGGNEEGGGGSSKPSRDLYSDLAIDVVKTTQRRESYQNFTPESEREFQYPCRAWWDEDFLQLVTKLHKKEIKPGRGNVARLHGEMAAVHWATPGARYSLRSQEEISLGGGDAGFRKEEASNGSAQDQRERRAAFTERIQKNEAWRSTKIDLALQLIQSRLDTTEGKILVFSSYLSCLDTLEVGLNLQEAETVILLGECWTAAQREQVISRAVRLGQKKVVVVYLLHALDSMDELVGRKCSGKQDKQMVLLNTFTYNPASRHSQIAKGKVEERMAEALTWDLDQFIAEIEATLVEDSAARKVARKRKASRNKDEESGADDEDNDNATDIVDDSEDEGMNDVVEADDNDEVGAVDIVDDSEEEDIEYDNWEGEEESLPNISEDDSSEEEFDPDAKVKPYSDTFEFGTKGPTWGVGSKSSKGKAAKTTKRTKHTKVSLKKASKQTVGKKRKRRPSTSSLE